MTKITPAEMAEPIMMVYPIDCWPVRLSARLYSRYCSVVITPSERLNPTFSTAPNRDEKMMHAGIINGAAQT